MDFDLAENAFFFDFLLGADGQIHLHRQRLPLEHHVLVKLILDIPTAFLLGLPAHDDLVLLLRTRHLHQPRRKVHLVSQNGVLPSRPACADDASENLTSGDADGNRAIQLFQFRN